MTKKRNRTTLLLLFEGILILLCGVIAVYLRFGEEAPEILGTRRVQLKLLLVQGVMQASFYLFDLYDFQVIRQRPVIANRVLQAFGLASMVMALIFYALPGIMLGRGVFSVALILMLSVIFMWRLMVPWLLGHPRLTDRVLILGTDDSAVTIAREVLDRKQDGYEVIGFIGEQPELVGKSILNPTVVGVMSDLEKLVAKYNPDRIIVALADRRGRLPLDLLLRFKLRDSINVEEAGTFYEKLTGKISTQRLQPGALVFSETIQWLGFYRRLRRLIDILSSILGLIISLPLMALIAIAIRLESKGPVFYRQERVGLHGVPFYIIKFRSMRTDAEKNGAVWATEKDTRITRIGRIIRKLRLDEIPQFTNILQGNMSLVGPRPERPEFTAQLEQVIPFYSERHLVKPGLTGWAQVCYPYGASIDDAREKHQYDLYYIKNQSPLLDVLILLETARVVLFGRLSR